MDVDLKKLFTKIVTVGVEEDTDEKLKKIRNKIKKNGLAGRQNFERTWYRNCLMYIGIQWIKFYKSTNTFQKAQISEFIPQPITNKLASTVDTIKSILTQRDPRVTIRPETDSEEDIATAEIGELINAVIDKESDIDECRKMSASWVTITGNTYAYTYYDKSEEHGIIEVPISRCNSCGQEANPKDLEDNKGACPNCQSHDIGESVDEQGNKKTLKFSRGKICTDSVSPFEMFFDNEISHFRKARVVVISRLKDTEELKDKYPELEDKIVSVSGDKDQLNQWYMQSLAYADPGSLTGSFAGAGMAGGSSGKIEKSVVDEVLMLPTKDFPQGQHAVIIGEVVVEKKELWSVDAKGNYFIPVAYCGAIYAPGRAHHKSPIDDVVPKQVQRNTIESLMQLGLLRMGSADWLFPKGTMIDKPTGTPGQIMEFLSVGGAEPKKVAGTPINASIPNFIGMIDRDIEDLGATPDAMKGQLPKGLKTFAGLKLLTERGFNRHMEMVRNWEDFNKTIKIHQIEVARKFMTEPRKMMIANQKGGWEMKTFSNADLTGSVEVIVEAGSTVPKSHAAEQALVLEEVEMGLIDVKDPKIHFKVMEKMGSVDLFSEADIDFKDATREWEEFKDSIKPALIAKEHKDKNWKAELKLRFREKIDNHQIHLQDHRSRAKSPEFFNLDPDIQKSWENHIFLHDAEIQKLMAQAQAMQQAEPKQKGKDRNQNSRMNSTEFMAV